MFRLLRMMRVQGCYDTALTMVGMTLTAAGYFGTGTVCRQVTTWMTVAALYYTAERR
jgi:hypothetical protein